MHGCRRQDSGFSLTEVLVTLVVMAVGMLGIAGLYVEGLQAGRSSAYRSAAVTLAADMAERMRSNPLGSYAGAGPGVDMDCVNGNRRCSASELAADDWYRWLSGLRQQLPTGVMASIQKQSAGSAEQYIITLSWPEAGQEVPASYTLALQL